MVDHLRINWWLTTPYSTDAKPQQSQLAEHGLR
jgi:hypothetical protein